MCVREIEKERARASAWCSNNVSTVYIGFICYGKEEEREYVCV